MLYNIIFLILVLYAMSTPLLVMEAIKFGMSIKGNPEKTDFTVFHLPKKKVEPKMTEEEKRNYQILQNIDRYDGTSAGQMEIK